MKHIVSAVLVLGARVVISDKLWTIAMAAGMILLAAALQGVRRGKTSRAS